MNRLRRWPRVSLRRWDRNRGFARAVNEGVRLSSGDWFLVLNPDVSLSPGFVEGVLALAQRLHRAEPWAGIIGFGLLNGDGTRQLSSGRFPTLASTLLRLFLPRSRRKYCQASPARLSQVSWTTGCCLLVRRACVEALGGFDPAFFLYYEDVDFCRRARAAGWSVWHEPRLQAIHERPLHRRPVSSAVRVLTRHALLTYAAKHWPAWQLQALAGIVRVEAWLRRGLARWRSDRDAEEHFDRLGALARDLATGRPRRARRHLATIVRWMEEVACQAACRS
jgi:GT2 family glycosyltransferase